MPARVSSVSSVRHDISMVISHASISGESFALLPAAARMNMKRMTAKPSSPTAAIRRCFIGKGFSQRKFTQSRGSDKISQPIFLCRAAEISLRKRKFLAGTFGNDFSRATRKNAAIGIPVKSVAIPCRGRGWRMRPERIANAARKDCKYGPRGVRIRPKRFRMGRIRCPTPQKPPPFGRHSAAEDG